MKNTLLLGLLIVIPFHKIAAQDYVESETKTEVNELELAPLKKEDHLIDVYYGYGSLIGCFLLEYFSFGSRDEI